MGIEMPVDLSRNVSLSEALRERTADVHQTAERSGIIYEILKQRAGREGYALLLRNLLPAYEMLELGLRERQNDLVFSVFAQPGLARAKAIRSDLASIVGDDYETSLPLLDEGRRYADRVASAGQGDGLRLISHAYVRYLGDLSGGQVLKKLLGRSMAMPPESLTIYDFPDIPDHGAFKDQLRRAIDVAAEIVSDQEDLIAEAVAAFEQNIALSNAVQAHVSSASS